MVKASLEELIKGSLLEEEDIIYLLNNVASIDQIKHFNKAQKEYNQEQYTASNKIKSDKEQQKYMAMKENNKTQTTLRQQNQNSQRG